MKLNINVFYILIIIVFVNLVFQIDSAPLSDPIVKSLGNSNGVLTSYAKGVFSNDAGTSTGYQVNYFLTHDSSGNLYSYDISNWNNTVSQFPLSSTTIVSAATSSSITNFTITGIANNGQLAYVMTKTQIMTFYMGSAPSGFTITPILVPATATTFPNYVYFRTPNNNQANGPVSVTYYTATNQLFINKYSLSNYNFQDPPTSIGPSGSNLVSYDVNFFVNDGSGFNVFGGSNRVSLQSDSSSTWNAATNTGYTFYAGVAFGSNIYSCATSGADLYLAKYEYNTFGLMIAGDKVGLGKGVRCLSAAADLSLGQLFFAYVTSTNLLAIATIAVTGQGLSTIVLQSYIVTASGLSTFSYPIGLRNNYIYLATPDAKIQMIAYTNLCPSQCSNHGNCYATTCSCTDDYITPSCAYKTPILTSVSPIPFYSTGASISLVGENFVSGAIITINNVVCGNAIVNQDGTVYTCTLPNGATTAWNPTLNQSVSMTFNSLSYFIPVVDLFQFSQPTITNYTQVQDKITLEGTNFYPLNYMPVTLNGNNLTCSINNNEISCNIPTQIPTRVGTLAVDIVPFEESLTLLPYIKEFTPTSIQTGNSEDVTITGCAFLTSSTTESFTVIQGSVSIPVSESDLTGTSIIFTPNNGIVATKTLVVKAGTYNSNSVTFTYDQPTITTVTQDQNATDQFSIVGTNFGNSANFVEVFVTNTEDLTIVSVNHELIVFRVPSDIRKGEVTVNIDSQTTAQGFKLNLQPKVTSISPLPPVNGGTITIFGEYLYDVKVFLSALNQTEELLNCTYSYSNYPSEAYCIFLPSVGQFLIDIESHYDTNVLTVQYQNYYHGPSITSISPTQYKLSTNQTFTITGDNFIESDLVILINGEECVLNGTVTFNQITCDYLSFVDQATIVNPVNVSVEVFGSGAYNNQLLIIEKSCPNNCSSHGDCSIITGKCDCDDTHTSNDCSQILNPPSSESSSTDSKSEDISSSTILIFNIYITAIFIIFLIIN
ncbi:hypothetical protein DLAC_10615 [Tieghemostelium lacteum]|uniref:IPT/TIG domain-containing protein n=1 Tax=Tieghemostelium lacteum TaxID=361077 RepID=A0A151Z4D2_TIELA|nr:hypothetical protein DLAC_10615 [Tieghemostelium lacteum]|eukprot:KYQ88816.1 hypothetical protein DLAC_10615 [Tieghemostelium lacteum]